MKLTRNLGLSLLTSLSLMAADSALAERQMEIVNQTGFEIIEFFSHRKGLEDWGVNLISEAPIGGYDARVFDFNDGSGYCLYSFKVVFNDGEALVSEDVNICDLPSFTYY